jgi:hypothetical protein
MSDNSEVSQLLRILIGLWARQAFPEDQLCKLVMPTSRSGLRFDAYNLCDGTRTRPDVYKALGLDKDNFNKLVNRWIQQGIVYEIEVGDRVYLNHVYPLPKDSKATAPEETDQLNPSPVDTQPELEM